MSTNFNKNPKSENSTNIRLLGEVLFHADTEELPCMTRLSPFEQDFCGRT
jgi:hypothetical protein